jgi:hypothetical protein
MYTSTCNKFTFFAATRYSLLNAVQIRSDFEHTAVRNGHDRPLRIFPKFDPDTFLNRSKNVAKRSKIDFECKL